MFLPIIFFIHILFIFYFPSYIIINLINSTFLFRSTENSHISTNLVHTLYHMQSIGTMPLTSLKKQLDPKSYKRCEEKYVETWYCLIRPIFLYYMYSVSLSAQSHHLYVRPSPNGSFRTNTFVSLP